MNRIDALDKKEIIIKYGKYIVLVIILVAIIFILKGCKSSYNDTEKKMIVAASKYISDNNIYVNSDTYLEMSKLGEIEGTEMCKKASGVLVSNDNGKLTYKPYLKCDNYESKLVNNKDNLIKLVGDEVVILNKGEIYEENGYTLKKDVDVKVFGNVLKTPGVYTLTYNAYDDNKLKGSASRIIIVTESDKNQNVSNLVNTIDPVITLMGDSELILKVGEKYVDPGYKAIDYTDGKISREVKVNPTKIDTSRPGGPYDITYTVTNSKGRTASVKRKVTVVSQKSNLNISLENLLTEISNKTKIKITITGSGYNYTLLPDNSITHNTSYIYEASYNKKYTFKIYDQYGNVYLKEIEVDNLDSTPPSGTCEALVIGNITEVSINATDNNGISGYSYILDDIETPFINETTYTLDSSVKNVSAKVRDIAGNESKLTCEVTIKEKTVTRGTSTDDPTMIDTSEYVIVSAKNDTLAFAKLVYSKNVAQNNNDKYSDACLSFAYYHAYLLYNGSANELNNMKAEDAAIWKYAEKFKAFNRDDLQLVLNKIYEEINAGRPAILHVNGNKAGTIRHYVTVVGYKASVKSANQLNGTDLLIIDSWDGKLERMDTQTSRFIISGYDTGRTTYGYSVTILR